MPPKAQPAKPTQGGTGVSATVRLCKNAPLLPNTPKTLTFKTQIYPLCDQRKKVPTGPNWL